MTEENAFESILNREFRWPKAGDRPFTQSQNWQDNAYIDPHGHGRLVMMMAGYKRAADLMVERAIADDVDQSSLVYPIIFNYRQFIELSLKYLISTYGHTVGVDAIWNTHDLGDLWKALMAVLTGYGHRDVDGTDPTVAQIVAEFAKVDPKSFSYRYPVDIKGRPIPIAHSELDLAALADVMNALDGYFSGTDGYLDSLQGAGP
ncbi:hypothetical protein ACQR16_03535 [Bradyrhizobium oligotrophicum]|uniref:hypothetical protein n=1 Tax=Bradyrhizobium oligotrophicum TaxID=44255 RepID=UPI003EC02C30